MYNKMAIRYLRAELRNLTFAVVVQVRLEDRFYNSETNEYSYFQGYSVDRSVERSGKPMKMIWFQKSNHLKKQIHIGPIAWNQKVPTHQKFVPREGDIIFGQTVKQEKGLKFKWWSVQGYPLLKFSEMLRYKRCRSKSLKEIYTKLTFYKENYPFRCQTCKHPIPIGIKKKLSGYKCFLCCTDKIEPNPIGDDKRNGMELVTKHSYPCSYVLCEDLWIIYNILIKNDYSFIVHPLQNKTYYSPSIFNQKVKKTIISYDPVRFMFLLSWICRSPSLYKKFVSEAKSINLAFPDDFKFAAEQDASEFSIKVLELLIKDISKVLS